MWLELMLFPHCQRLEGELSADLPHRSASFSQIAQNFDPTGVAGTIDQLLSEDKAQREQDRILLAIYGLTKAFVQYSHRIERLEESYLSTKFPAVTHLYFEHSERTLYPSKIRWFRNIWLNSLFAEDKSSSEASIIYDIIQSLTEDEIRALKFIYHESKTETKELKHIHINSVAEALNIGPAYAQQLCIRLRTQGLIGESSEGMSFGSGPPATFMLMDFTEVLIKYIVEPSL
jgi:lipopolysaccharide biosynthesis regulator YciM